MDIKKDKYSEENWPTTFKQYQPVIDQLDEWAIKHYKHDYNINADTWKDVVRIVDQLLQESIRKERREFVGELQWLKSYIDTALVKQTEEHEIRMNDQYNELVDRYSPQEDKQ